VIVGSLEYTTVFSAPKVRSNTACGNAAGKERIYREKPQRGDVKLDDIR
jgi:hypothetical protein